MSAALATTSGEESVASSASPTPGPSTATCALAELTATPKVRAHQRGPGSLEATTSGGGRPVWLMGAGAISHIQRRERDE